MASSRLRVSQLSSAQLVWAYTVVLTGAWALALSLASLLVQAPPWVLASSQLPPSQLSASQLASSQLCSSRLSSSQPGVASITASGTAPGTASGIYIGSVAGAVVVVGAGVAGTVLDAVIVDAGVGVEDGFGTGGIVVDAVVVKAGVVDTVVAGVVGTW